MKRASRLIARSLAEGHNMELACLLVYNFGKHSLVMNRVIVSDDTVAGSNKEVLLTK